MYIGLQGAARQRLWGGRSDGWGRRRTRQLVEHFAEIILQARVCGHEHAEAILVDLLERLRRVDATLVQDAVDAIGCARLRVGKGNACRGQPSARVQAIATLTLGGEEQYGSGRHSVGNAPKNSVTISTDPLRLMLVLLAWATDIVM